MNPNPLQQRYAVLREQAARGADVATFAAYEQLWKDAKAAGDHALTKRVLRDLTVLTAQLDPQLAKSLAAACAATPGGPDVTVVVAGVPERANESPALRSLARQSVAQERIETIVADRDDAAARSEALRAARGAIVLFVAHDVALADDAVARHLAAHAAGGTPRAVLGAIEWEGLALRPLAWTLDGLGLLGCQAGMTTAGDAPAECVALDHASFPRQALLDAGGIDAGLGPFAGAELGVRLAAAKWTITVDPAIGAKRTPSLDLATWLARCRAMGGDWPRLRQLHGAAARPAWMAEIGLEQSAGDALLERLLAGSDRHARCVAALRDSLVEIELAVARDPAGAAALLEKLRADLTATLLDVTRHELIRGFVHATKGGASEQLERCAVRTERGAAVVVLANDGSAQAATLALTELPAWGEVVVAIPEGAPERPLPADPRLRRLRLPAGAGAPHLKRALLESCGADFFVLLDGSLVPTRADWEALRLTLATLPNVGACNVEGEGGPLAKARLAAHLPNDLVAVRRDVIESDDPESGPLLDRLVRRGYRFATATPARESTACSR